jgi:hypothetical protein
MKKGNLKKLVSGAVLSAAILTAGATQIASAHYTEKVFNHQFQFNDNVKATGEDVKLNNSSVYKYIDSWGMQKGQSYTAYVLAVNSYSKRSGYFTNTASDAYRQQWYANSIVEVHGPNTNTAIRSTYSANRLGSVSGVWHADSYRYNTNRY